MAEHKVDHAVIIICTLVAMMAMFFMTRYHNGDIIPSVYRHPDIEEIWEKYYTEMTPAATAWSIWLVYALQVLFIMYGLSTLFRKWPEGYLYCSPKVLPIGIYLFYIANCALNVLWLILFDRELMRAALGVIVVMWLTRIAPLVMSHITVHDNVETMQEYNTMREVWLIRFLVQNVHAFYLTWVTLAMLLNFAIIMTYHFGFDMSQVSTLSLGILALDLLLWIALDFFVLYRYTYYLFSPYFLLMVALGVSTRKNFTPGHINSIINVILLLIALGAFILKAFLMIVSFCRKCTEKPSNHSQRKHPAPA